jgi:hypothetical protein
MTEKQQYSFCIKSQRNLTSNLKVRVGKLAHFLGGNLAHCANVPRGEHCSILYVTCYFRHFNFVLGNVIMPRSCNRKDEKANIVPDTVLRAVRAVRIENRSIRSVARYFGIPFHSLKRYCSRASEDYIRGISQNQTLSTGYKKTRQVS